MYRVQYWNVNSFPRGWNFKCNQCSYKCLTDFCFKVHQAQHQDLFDPSCKHAKKYACHRCGKRFRELANFVFHRTLHEQPRRRKVISDVKTEPLEVDSNSAQNIEESKGRDHSVDCSTEGYKEDLAKLDTSGTYMGLLKHEIKTEENEDMGEIVLTIEDSASDREIDGNQAGEVYVIQFVDDNQEISGVEDRKLKCSRCHEAFSGTEELKLHTRTCTKLYVCTFCGKTLSSSQVLREHELKHKGQCPYVCDICGGKFGRQDSLRKHKRIHLGIKKYVCDECGKVFTEGGSLGKHKRIHTGSKPFVCQVCGRGFVQSGQLATHKRTHTGEKPFPCPRCNYRFTTQSSLSRHLRVHDGIKRFKCPLCKGMTFLTKEGLYNHFIMHNEESLYTCDMCHRTFAREQNLTKHMKLHESKPGKIERLVCKLCEKTFSSGTSLRRHHRRCHQAKPYSCQLCNKAFATEQSLSKHLLTHPDQSVVAVS